MSQVSLASPPPNPHILTELSRVYGRGLHGPLITFTGACSLDNSSSSSPYSSPCSSESSDSEVESEEDSECEEYLECLDREDGSAKCLDPDTDSRSGWSGWNDTEPIASEGGAKN